MYSRVIITNNTMYQIFEWFKMSWSQVKLSDIFRQRANFDRDLYTKVRVKVLYLSSQTVLQQNNNKDSFLLRSVNVVDKLKI